QLPGAGLHEQQRRDAADAQRPRRRRGGQVGADEGPGEQGHAGERYHADRQATAHLTALSLTVSVRSATAARRSASWVAMTTPDPPSRRSSITRERESRAAPSIPRVGSSRRTRPGAPASTAAAAAGPQQARDDPKQGPPAASIRAHERDHLATPDREVHLREDDGAAEAGGDVGERRRSLGG